MATKICSNGKTLYLTCMKHGITQFLIAFVVYSKLGTHNIGLFDDLFYIFFNFTFQLCMSIFENQKYTNILMLKRMKYDPVILNYTIIMLFTNKTKPTTIT